MLDKRDAGVNRILDERKGTHKLRRRSKPARLLSTTARTASPTRIQNQSGPKRQSRKAKHRPIMVAMQSPRNLLAT